MSDSRNVLADRGLVAEPPPLAIDQPARVPFQMMTFDLPPDYQARVQALHMSIRFAEMSRMGSGPDRGERTLDRARDFLSFLIARNPADDKE